MKTAWKSASLGRALALEGQYGPAWALLTESLVLFHNVNNVWGVALCIRDLGQVAQQQGKHEQAARLVGAASALFASLDPTLSFSSALQYNGNVSALNAHLNLAAFAVAYGEGREMTVEQAIAYALEEPINAG